MPDSPSDASTASPGWGYLIVVACCPESSLFDHSRLIRGRAPVYDYIRVRRSVPQVFELVGPPALRG
jgi:hypothetical protein